MVRWLVGADEAGRGSLIGELIVAVAAVREDCMDLIKTMGVRDSKELGPEERAYLYNQFSKLDCIVFAVHPIRPWEIDQKSLTYLTEEAISNAFKRLTRHIDPSKISRFTIDKYGKIIKIKILLSKSGYKGPLIVEEKADTKYLEVSAASIIAKHVRDSRLRALSSLYGVRGSGYPSDPRTVEWVMDVINKGEKPPIIRYSWGTLEGTGLRVRKKKKQGEQGITLEDFF